MKVTLYTREDCPDCKRVWEMLLELTDAHGFTLHESASPEGAPAPCIRFEAPGSPFYRAEDLTSEQFLAYLQDARQKTSQSESTVSGGHSKATKRAGAPPDSEFERTHPIRSYLWRHRVGGIVSALSLFTGLAWVAPLTTSLGLGNGFYNAVHSAYSIVCDQIPERSAQVGGLPVCLCWRCTAIYGASLLLGIIYTIGRDRKIGWLNWLRSPISVPMLLLFALPLTLDGVSHAAGWRSGIAYANSPDFWLSWGVFSADWWLRIATSLIAIVGAVKFLCPRLDKLGYVYEKLHRERTSPQPQGTATQASNA